MAKNKKNKPISREKRKDIKEVRVQQSYSKSSGKFNQVNSVKEREKYTDRQQSILNKNKNRGNHDVDMSIQRKVGAKMPPLQSRHKGYGHGIQPERKEFKELKDVTSMLRSYTDLLAINSDIRYWDAIVPIIQKFVSDKDVSAFYMARYNRHSKKRFSGMVVSIKTFCRDFRRYFINPPNNWYSSIEKAQSYYRMCRDYMIYHREVGGVKTAVLERCRCSQEKFQLVVANKRFLYGDFLTVIDKESRYRPNFVDRFKANGVEPKLFRNSGFILTKPNNKVWRAVGDSVDAIRSASMTLWFDKVASKHMDYKSVQDSEFVDRYDWLVSGFDDFYKDSASVYERFVPSRYTNKQIDELFRHKHFTKSNRRGPLNGNNGSWTNRDDDEKRVISSCIRGAKCDRASHYHRKLGPKSDKVGGERRIGAKYASQDENNYERCMEPGCKRMDDHYHIGSSGGGKREKQEDPELLEEDEEMAFVKHEPEPNVSVKPVLPSALGRKLTSNFDKKPVRVCDCGEGNLDYLVCGGCSKKRIDARAKRRQELREARDRERKVDAELNASLKVDVKLNANAKEFVPAAPVQPVGNQPNPVQYVYNAFEPPQVARIAEPVGVVNFVVPEVEPEGVEQPVVPPVVEQVNQAVNQENLLPVEPEKVDGDDLDDNNGLPDHDVLFRRMVQHRLGNIVDEFPVDGFPDYEPRYRAMDWRVAERVNMGMLEYRMALDNLLNNVMDDEGARQGQAMVLLRQLVRQHVMQELRERVADGLPDYIIMQMRMVAGIREYWQARRPRPEPRPQPDPIPEPLPNPQPEPVPIPEEPRPLADDLLDLDAEPFLWDDVSSDGSSDHGDPEVEDPEPFDYREVKLFFTRKTEVDISTSSLTVNPDAFIREQLMKTLGWIFFTPTWEGVRVDRTAVVVNDLSHEVTDKVETYKGNWFLEYLIPRLSFTVQYETVNLPVYNMSYVGEYFPYLCNECLRQLGNVTFSDNGKTIYQATISQIQNVIRIVNPNYFNEEHMYRTANTIIRVINLKMMFNSRVGSAVPYKAGVENKVDKNFQ